MSGDTSPVTVTETYREGMGLTLTRTPRILSCDCLRICQYEQFDGAYGQHKIHVNGPTEGTVLTAFAILYPRAIAYS